MENRNPGATLLSSTQDSMNQSTASGYNGPQIKENRKERRARWKREKDELTKKKAVKKPPFQVNYKYTAVKAVFYAMQ